MLILHGKMQKCISGYSYFLLGVDSIGRWRRFRGENIPRQWGGLDLDALLYCISHSLSEMAAENYEEY